MTLKELSQLYYLSKEINRDRKRLRQLRSVDVQIAKLTDMPRPTKVIYDPMAEKVSTVVDLENNLKRSIAKCYRQELKLTKYINQIDDCLIRLILKLRFIDRKSWWDVANIVGGGNTDASVKMLCYRFIRRKIKA